MFRYLPFFVSLAAATNLYATHYDGNIYSLSLDGGNSLSITSSLKTCGDGPSWLTFDSPTRTLYCSDHAGDAIVNGSLSSYAVDQNGRLTEIAQAVDVGAAVHSIMYTDKDGAKYLAVAHYGGSAMSTFKLPLNSDDEALQVFRYQLSEPGIRPEQDAAHPHQVILDPTGAFILVPDLGADQVRVYAIDMRHSGRLNACPSLNFPAGSGPRHGLFWKSKPSHFREASVTMLYTVSELGGRFNAFAVTYPSSGCLAFKETQSFVPYPGGQLPADATPSELRMAGTSSLYASIRFDQGFPPNDSLATLVHSPNGTVTFGEITSSYGTIPRTFAINKNGTLVAIGNQASSNVAIVMRDPQSGNLGSLLANLQVGEPGQASNSSTGLSSIIWEE
ncbi:Lactonase, 7-bladed beta-propeller-domain-containing protein [Aspergillus pseudoustus]|uniref:Lactonase, 7-bladed beta-propeller-domain-containing protein n=1 Tax=Aspergillus pseudoustus TaxID=1810923 RepID=A0ABR4JRR9_9EURO